MIAQRRQPLRFHQQGAILIIALLTMLTITGLGLIAVRTATGEMHAAAAYRLNKQATFGAMGMSNMSAVELETKSDTYWQIMKTNAIAAADAGTDLALIDVDKQYLFSHQDFNDIFMANPTGDLSQTALPYAGGTLVSNPVEAGQAPGYSGQFCFKRVRIDSAGSIGVPPPFPLTLAATVQRFARSRIFGYAVMGPMECPGN